jgi:hypothetical protein
MSVNLGRCVLCSACCCSRSHSVVQIIAEPLRYRHLTFYEVPPCHVLDEWFPGKQYLGLENAVREAEQDTSLREKIWRWTWSMRFPEAVCIDILVRMVRLVGDLRTLDLQGQLGLMRPMLLLTLRDIARNTLVRLKVELQVYWIESWTPLSHMLNLRMLSISIMGTAGSSPPTDISAWSEMSPLLLSKLVFLIWEAYIVELDEQSAALAFLTRCRFISLQDFRIRSYYVAPGDEDQLMQFFVHHPSITSVRFDDDASDWRVIEAILPQINARRVSLSYIPEDVRVIQLLSSTPVQDLFLGIDYSAPLDDLWRLLKDLHEIYTSIRYVVVQAQEGDDVPGPVLWELMHRLAGSDEEHNMDWLGRLAGHAWRLQEKGIDVLDEHGNIGMMQTVEKVIVVPCCLHTRRD